MVAAFVFAAPAAVASADDNDPPVLTFDQATISTTYGEFWTLRATAVRTYSVVGPWTGTATISGPGSPLIVPVSSRDAPGTTTYIDIYQNTLLDVGTYTFSASASSPIGGSVSSTSPATLTVTPSTLGVDVIVASDPGAPGNAIVSARLTGEITGGFSPTVSPYAPQAPAGTWHISVIDSEGKPVVDYESERAAGGANIATSFYWTDPEPAKQYTATATFTASGPTGAYYTVTPSHTFAFTASASTRPTPTSTATPTPPTDDVHNTAEQQGLIALPLWSLIAAGALIAGFVALVAVLSVRLALRRNTGESTAPEALEVER